MTMDTPTEPDNLATTLLKSLMDHEPAEAHAQANDMLAAATALLCGWFGPAHALDLLRHAGEVVQAQDPAPSPAPVPAIPPAPPAAGEVATAVLATLRGLPRDEAHERARAVVAGSGAYLHETYGLAYASALLRGTLDAAADHGLLVRSGPGAGVTLH